jgi:hypothetical protein
MGSTVQRLAALEQKQQQSQHLGIRIFQQSEDTAEVFYEVPGAFYDGPQGYTRDDLSLLSADGWQLIIVVYGQEPPHRHRPTRQADPWARRLSPAQSRALARCRNV